MQSNSRLAHADLIQPSLTVSSLTVSGLTVSGLTKRGALALLSVLHWSRLARLRRRADCGLAALRILSAVRRASRQRLGTSGCARAIRTLVASAGAGHAAMTRWHPVRGHPVRRQSVPRHDVGRHAGRRQAMRLITRLRAIALAASRDTLSRWQSVGWHPGRGHGARRQSVRCLAHRLGAGAAVLTGAMRAEPGGLLTARAIAPQPSRISVAVLAWLGLT
jgi:hypothetical protein